MFEATIPLIESDRVLALFGVGDRHVRSIRESLGVSITHRNGQIRVLGEEAAVAKATFVIEQLKTLLDRSGNVDANVVASALNGVVGRKPEFEMTSIDVYQPGRKVSPRTVGQARYVEAVRNHDLTIAIGPAGCGKTYLAVALAVEALKHSRVRKIVLVRPAVEAGESLGFLPGDLQAKIHPYLRPLLDSLHEMVDHEQIKRYMELDVIEVIPLAYMRGRTLNEAFVILDEAQNATMAQMKMFLTRMGASSKIVVSGDVTQVDLPKHAQSGLMDARRRLQTVEGVAMIELSQADIVRHRLVADIVRAYEEAESEC